MGHSILGTQWYDTECIIVFLDTLGIFPFGVNAGDALAPPGDDVASPVTVLNEPITFFGRQYREVIVSQRIV